MLPGKPRRNLRFRSLRL
uniref:Putative phenylalanyl-tRNA synthetase alpha chain n=1 Tax=Rhizophora mucronata TaxID=61149 RepID=A0A2P2M1J1_RHIMU